METRQEALSLNVETTGLNPESIQSEEAGSLGKTEANLSTGYVFTDDKDSKRFYLDLATRLCPSITPDCTELQKLHILHTRIRKTCKLLSLLDNHPWTDVHPLMAKACGFFMLTTESGSGKEKKKLNNLLYMQSEFMGKMAGFHDSLAHNLMFFSRIKNDLDKMLHINGTGAEADYNESNE